MSRVVALSGGVGGAKLALGLSRVLPADELLIVANTGDDFEHLGVSISPDIDTLLYTLSGLANPDLGWGRADESWAFMETLATLGEPTWFRLGDRDLALHVARTRRLAAGESLSAITDDFRGRLGVGPKIVPMSDDRVRTKLDTNEGNLDFQDYFVRLQCRPSVRALRFDGAEQAKPQPDFLAALTDPGLRAVIICPSNPFISIEPILAIPGVRDALAACRAPVVAVSPIVGGRAVKGPTAKMMQELGLATSAAAVASRYGRLINGFICDEEDATGIDGPRVFTAPTLMRDLADRETLARVALDAADRLR